MDELAQQEFPVGEDLVRQLLADQFPRWAGLPLTPVRHAGTDNAIFRLGDDLAVRLPRVAWAAGQAEKEHQWLPRLAPHLPLAVPTPVALGRPTEAYPWAWTVCPWIEGETLQAELLVDHALAEQLAGFITALQRVDVTGGPKPGRHNFHRGVALRHRDQVTRESIAALGDEYDLSLLTEAWEAVLRLPDGDGPRGWVHGDLHEGNLLAQDGRLVAAIDFGGLAVGDTACDLMTAWMIFTADAREAFRRAMAADDAAWARGRGWALSVSLVQLPFYRDSNPFIAGLARRTLREVLSDG